MLNNIYYFLTGLLSFKFRSNLKRKFVSYVAANNLDKKIENFINYKNGFYVELGANDGINQSNTFYFEKKKKIGKEYSLNHLKIIIKNVKEIDQKKINFLMQHV